MNLNTITENNSQTNFFYSEPTNFCIQTQKIVFELRDQTRSYFLKNSSSLPSSF